MRPFSQSFGFRRYNHPLIVSQINMICGGGLEDDSNIWRCAPGAGRTRNQLIRSQVLYPLSYEGNDRDYNLNLPSASIFCLL